MRILVLGAYGLIGEPVTRALVAAGHGVTGLGRTIAAAERRHRDVSWLAADIAGLLSPDDWGPLLERSRAEAIVNSAGALQSGLRDDVAAVQSAAMVALFEAAARHGVRRFVQISAGRASPDADTLFMRSKGEADVALSQSDLDWVILRPGLVLAPQAYGGTAVLRALAGFPIVLPVAYADCPLQTVSVADVADAVVRAVEGRVETRATYDLVEDAAPTVGDVVGEMRAWLGLRPAPVVAVPASLVGAVSWVADGLSWLGWRSPLRSTAVRELSAGVVGDPEPWRRQTGASLRALAVSLRDMPASLQERWFARAFVFKPIAIATLSLFWLTTGVIALADPGRAADVLISRGVGEASALAAVIGGAAVDLALGLGILWRSASAWAAAGMIAVTAIYLAAGSILAPDIWLDPLGAYVKAVPCAVLALAVLAFEGDR